ncbi:unnamed protein product [Cochlearia groenlandica]
MNSQVDPAMIISKQLSKSDYDGCIISLPKHQVMSVLTKMNGVTVESLQAGIVVQVHDTNEDDLYTVTLKSSADNTRFFFCNGWTTIKLSLDLQEGQDFKIYWDQRFNKFIVINHPENV